MPLSWVPVNSYSFQLEPNTESLARVRVDWKPPKLYDNEQYCAFVFLVFKVIFIFIIFLCFL